MADVIEAVAEAICRSRKFECGQGCCAPICMEGLGDVRASGCGHAMRLHGDLAKAALAAAGAARLEGWKRRLVDELGDPYCDEDKKILTAALSTITAQAARIEALERPSETMIKAATERLRECLNVLEVGDAPTRDFAHDVLEAAFAARATLEGK